MSEKIAPKGTAVPVGQYSHAIKVSPKYLVFVAGQGPSTKTEMLSESIAGKNL
jgi:enamine deaminase RidA (YjgF/YER057c/UK114 family)